MPKVMCLERRGCYKENGHPGQCVNGDCFGLSTDRSDQRKVRPVGWNYMACRRYMKKERQVAGMAAADRGEIKRLTAQVAELKSKLADAVGNACKIAEAQEVAVLNQIAQNALTV